MSHHISDFFHIKFFLVAPTGFASEIFGLPVKRRFQKYILAPSPPPLIYLSQCRGKCTKCVQAQKF